MPRTTARRQTIASGLAAVAGGAWGAVACGAAFGAVAEALGAPSGTEDGEMVPGLGWNRLTAFLVGVLVGLVAGSLIAVRVSRRWPRTAGTLLAAVGALAVITALAEPSFWRLTALLLVVPALVWAAVLASWRRRVVPR